MDALGYGFKQYGKIIYRINYDVTTDENGSWTDDNIPDGYYLIAARPSNYQYTVFVTSSNLRAYRIGSGQTITLVANQNIGTVITMYIRS